MTNASNVRVKPLWTWSIIGPAILDAFRKLNPRTLMKNPVMFVVEVGSVATTIAFLYDLAKHVPGTGFSIQITLWLWFTVLFANFAEAMAEGREKRRRIPCARRDSSRLHAA